ncbi:aldehyde dehydrogenase family protein [Occallatibacter riparius]|uniref:Aldehyde dehydrogenase n=1 Tax=Occallatibacter riparius TaxID=1002689 RepID=A0A9J7BIG7_9BACT|nr:aldehyde dehydrogenase family protein [Occallatibacter riparius]UWZ82289.1 aldehyde dehydrogenase family protein [Occallatibacter riparius]
MDESTTVKSAAAQDVSLPHERLRQLRQSVDSGIVRPLAWRLAQLGGLLRFVDEQEEAMLEALKADLGRCRADARMADVSMVRAEIRLMQKNLRRWLRPRRVRTPLAAQPGRSWTQPEPFGLALILGTWNYPFQQILIPLAGALAAGNSAVMKLPESAPHSSTLMAAHLERYVDPEAVIVISGGPETASQLLELRFDKIFYTGSSRVGRIVMAAAAANLTPVTLELGGKNPVIVAEDAPIEITARRIAWGRFMNCGQLCVAPDCVLVPERLRIPLIEALGEAIVRFYGSDPQRSESYGRIVNATHFARLQQFLKEGRVVIGGQSDEKDRYIAPTVLTDIPDDATVLRDEIFGPILPVIGYDSLEQALSFVRSRPKPLQLHLFTKDRRLQHQVVNTMSAGTIVVNDSIVSQIVPDLPFGGVGDSGMGSFHGRYTFEAFSRPKAVLHRSFRADLDARYPPFTGMKDRILRWLIS